MLRLGLKSLLANKIRFALTASTITIGVAFVVAAFVTADSLRDTFGDLAEDINTGTEFTIRGQLAFGDLTEGDPPPVPENLVESVLAVEGVAAAEGGFFVDGVVPVDGSGVAVTTFGPPVAGANWTVDEKISQFFLITGEKPVGMTEFALDVGTFADYDFELGKDYEVITPTGPRTFTLTGTIQFGFPDNAGVGATFSLFDKETAQEVLGYGDEFDQIGVRVEPGADLAAVEQQLAAVLPDGVEIISASDATEEFSDAFETFIGPLQTILLAFAFVVLFVSAFIISNTFNIVLGQRVRELSLLRAIGATPRQVRRSVLTESFAIGIVASVVGLGLGMAGALGIRAIFSTFAEGLPAGSLPLSLRTVIWAAVVGIGFTVMASLVPAIKASRISPMAGLHDEYASTSRQGNVMRPVVGAVLLAAGLALTGWALFGDFDSATPQLITLAAGGAIVFIAVAVLSPLVAGAIVGAISRPLPGLLGTPGQLARNNSIRNPRRTAATAVALTIGLSLVTMVAVMAESLKVSFGERFSTAVTADFVITANTQAGLPKPAGSELRAAGIGTVVAIDFDRVKLTGLRDTDGTVTELISDMTAIDVAGLGEVADLDITAGSLGGFDPAAGLLIHEDAAADYGLDIGDKVVLGFVNGDSRVVAVEAVFTRSALWSNWIIDQSLYAEVSTAAFDDILLVATTIDDPEAARASVDQVLETYPQADVDDRQEFQAGIESNLDTVLVISTVFLGFALLIALIGIVNTLTLSVFERTREIGLMRAVGMTGRQLRRMIRWEAVAVALYGALVGLVLGLAFGIAAIAAIPDDIIGTVAVPIVWLVVFLALSLVFGLIAALFPAFRASKMNVLDAIADE
ncbi:ABC transporter permease [Candidatus Poriferisodalis sp.]|uniref:ABC transporter permease n=1 Tax=Candidatus Poriferisodalis sp. TaxID=3101277 RepID=UPI003B59EC51